LAGLPGGTPAGVEPADGQVQQDEDGREPANPEEEPSSTVALGGSILRHLPSKRTLCTSGVNIRKTQKFGNCPNWAGRRTGSYPATGPSLHFGDGADQGGYPPGGDPQGDLP
jgi:hypothetical protein